MCGAFLADTIRPDLNIPCSGLFNLQYSIFSIITSRHWPSWLLICRSLLCALPTAPPCCSAGFVGAAAPAPQPAGYPPGLTRLLPDPPDCIVTACRRYWLRIAHWIGVLWPCSYSPRYGAGERGMPRAYDGGSPCSDDANRVVALCSRPAFWSSDWLLRRPKSGANCWSPTRA